MFFLKAVLSQQGKSDPVGYFQLSDNLAYLMFLLAESTYQIPQGCSVQMGSESVWVYPTALLITFLERTESEETYIFITLNSSAGLHIKLCSLSGRLIPV